MADIASLFVTRLYRAALSELGRKIDPKEMAASCLAIAEDDEAGQRWCEANGYAGYTSYASLADLPWRFPVFATLEKVLDRKILLDQVEYPDSYPADEPQRRCPDITKAVFQLGYEPQVPLEVGLGRFMNWALERYKGL